MASIPQGPAAFFRLSPAQPGKAHCFAVKRGAITERADVNYSACTLELNRVYAKPRYPLMLLRDLVTVVQYGASARASEQRIGFPILRMNNLQNDGWDLSDIKFIELSESEARSYKLEKGDILFNRTNSKELVGKCEVFREEGHWVFASYLIRVRLDTTQADPDFVSTFLSTSAGRVQIDRVSRQIIGMSNVNAEELRDLRIPLPPLPVQQQLVGEMGRARESRRGKRAEADTLLASLDAFLLNHLGLTLEDSNHSMTYAIRLPAIRGSKQIGADYFHPERMSALRAIQTAKHAKRAARLEDVAEFIREVSAGYEPGEYLGLAGVQSQTGELADAKEEPGKGQAFRYKEYDVLFARLRPYLNKVWRAERIGVCSTEFHVIRIKVGAPDLLPDYLAAVLRSSIIVAQTIHMMTGNTHPRLANEDVVDLLIPIPKEKTQQEIVDELSQRRLQARRLRKEAARDWEAAKARFEARLLGGERAR